MALLQLLLQLLDLLLLALDELAQFLSSRNYMGFLLVDKLR